MEDELEAKRLKECSKFLNRKTTLLDTFLDPDHWWKLIAIGFLGYLVWLLDTYMNMRVL